MARYCVAVGSKKTDPLVRGLAAVSRGTWRKALSASVFSAAEVAGSSPRRLRESLY